MKFAKIIAINVILLLAILEGASFVYFKLELSISNYRPSYVSKAFDTESQWMSEYNDWGAWHVPQGRAAKERRCFSVDLIANSYGARDKERAREASDARTIVLGDSFVEGYGVDASVRFSDLLEARHGREYLNFGASGNFGPAQYAILYRELAREFSHDHVVIAILPDNDFTDNDPKYWQTNDKRGYELRYRPYWQKSQDGFEVFYPVEKPQSRVTFASYNKKASEGPSLKSKIQRLFWTYGVYREIRYISRGATLEAGTYSGYFDASQEQIESAKFFIKEIQSLAEGRKVSFFTIPRLSDLKRLSDTPSDMVAQFSAFGEENNIAYVDLAPKMNAAVDDVFSLFLPCDGHWSPLGHKIAADILQEELNLN